MRKLWLWHCEKYIGKYNYSDLNGDLLIKNNKNEPIWFDNVSPFDEGFLDTLTAYGIKDGRLVYFYSDGKYILTNIPAAKYGFTSTSILESKHYFLYFDCPFQIIYVILQLYM